MKKLVMKAVLGAALILSPFASASGLEMMSADSMKDVTAQAGVSMALDDIVIYQASQPTTTYWDMDGFSSVHGTVGQVKAAGVEISYDTNAQKLILIDGVLDANTYGTNELISIFGSDTDTSASITDTVTGETTDNDAIVDALGNVVTAGILEEDVVSIGCDPSNGRTGNYTNGISPLTIDVGSCTALSTGLQYNRQNTGLDVAGVTIGLPTIEIKTFHTDDIKIIKIVNKDASVVANSGETVPFVDGTGTPTGEGYVSNELIRIEKSGASTLAILGGTLEIAPH